MTVEFTGERVIPGQVDIDLWNEHLSRYAFATRLARHRRVLDLGCGTGYGAAELAAVAHCVTGLDISHEAVSYGAEHYSRANIRWVRASSTSLPFANGSFDLVIGFEVIEHLVDWPDLIREAQRVLAPGGQFIVSTPNKLFYAESRDLSGPNPFHEHEFEFEEFRDALAGIFSHVSLFLQDHTEGILFRSVAAQSGADVRIQPSGRPPAESFFFIAVCAMTPQTGSPAFVFLPSNANLLKERTEHIRRLEEELRTKEKWLQDAQDEHQKLVELFREQKVELEKSNSWATEVDEKLKAALNRITQLQQELVDQETAGRQVTAGYEAKLAELESENVKKTEWARDNEKRFNERTEELVKCVEMLNSTQQQLDERTTWAQQLQAKLGMVAASRWVRLGRVIGLGPELRNG